MPKGEKGHLNFFKNRERIVPGLQRGLILVLARDGGTDRHPRYRVRCEGCAAEYTMASSTLSSAKGCKKCRHGGSQKKYGSGFAHEDPLYRYWIQMRYRCTPNPNDLKTIRWWGRGIKVTADWHDFLKFKEWSMAHGFKPGLSLDRVDNDGNYCPENCEWVTRSENSRRMQALYTMVRKPKVWDHVPIEALWGTA